MLSFFFLATMLMFVDVSLKMPSVVDEQNDPSIEGVSSRWPS